MREESNNPLIKQRCGSVVSGQNSLVLVRVRVNPNQNPGFAIINVRLLLPDCSCVQANLSCLHY